MKDIIFYFLCYVVEAIIIWQYSVSLFIPKHSDKRRGLVLIIGYFVMFLLSFMGQIWVNVGSFLAINFIFLFTQHELRLGIALFHSSVMTAIMSMSELAVYGIISLFSPHFYTNPSLFYQKFLLAIFSKIIYFFIAYIFSHLFNIKNKRSAQENISAILLGFIPLSTIFAMFTFANIEETSEMSFVNSCLIAISASVLLLSNLLIFGINQYNQRKNSAFTEMQVLLQKEYDSAEYYKMLLQQNENQSILIHDIKKHLQTIDLLNEKKDSEKITAYIHQLLKSSDLKEFSRLCDHEMLNAILSRYKRQCSKQKIEFIADIRNGTTNFMSDSDLTALFCNLLDNAMEAAAGIPNGYIEINIAKKAPSDFVIISVINSCRNDPFAPNSHSLVTKKTDKKKHGFGIKSIKKIVAKYEGSIQMHYNNDALTFHTIITLIPQEGA